MEYVSRGQHGQYFTPMNISDMMALCSGASGSEIPESVVAHVNPVQLSLFDF